MAFAGGAARSPPFDLTGSERDEQIVGSGRGLTN